MVKAIEVEALARELEGEIGAEKLHDLGYRKVGC